MANEESCVICTTRLHFPPVRMYNLGFGIYHDDNGIIYAIYTAYYIVCNIYSSYSTVSDSYSIHAPHTASV